MRTSFILLYSMILSALAWGQVKNAPLTIDQKIKAFDEFEEQSVQRNLARESDREELLQERKARAKEREKQLEDYLQEKRKEKKEKPEESAAYQEFLLKKWEWRNSLEKAATDAIKIKQALKPGKKEREFEVREYALQDTEKDRIPFNKRKILGGKLGGGSSSGGGFGGGGGGGGAPPFIPPPPIEDVPDFDNDIPPPPPPPPPMGGGDFDEVEPMPIPPPPPME